MCSTPKVRIGTRGSRLARWQADGVAGRLLALHPGLEVEIVEIKTQGDRDRESPLESIGGVGVFTKEIQRVLLERKIEIAVHSLKDLPTEPVAGLVLAATPEREDVADALITSHATLLESLPEGARIGTSSSRRKAQLLHIRPDLRVEAVRGNVETRLKLVSDGKLDGVLLAMAGLARLGLISHVTERLAPPRFLPAVGQGALGVECRDDDLATRELLARLDHPQTKRAVIAERSLLHEVSGGCMMPLAAWARDRDDHQMTLDAILFSEDLNERFVATATGPVEDPESIGIRVAHALIDAIGATPTGTIRV